MVVVVVDWQVRWLAIGQAVVRVVIASRPMGAVRGDGWASRGRGQGASAHSSVRGRTWVSKTRGVGSIPTERGNQWLLAGSYTCWGMGASSAVERPGIGYWLRSMVVGGSGWLLASWGGQELGSRCYGMVVVAEL